ncbi:bZIP transcription factor 44 [Ricinus communis]|uniref:Ocs element-binding factor, putative n=1 Tax=Ricinus communis TaxID=3988 RepID=B9S6A2_RICCO|nr:bZIP transcription factor 44 [Ricinus communis]EEF40792.1 Ocs element-binding factor, putative [Ricinus communis]|eukprot:XP_002521521.1 bZIP transcription factor 44 [Ricinus communis]
MATSSGASSGSSSLLPNSSSEDDLQQQKQIMDQRKRKRMVSNRESAHRSRMRKQKHMDDLMVQLGQLKKESIEIFSSFNITSQLYLNLEGENSVLRAQVTELTNRLDSLSEIINYMNLSNGFFEGGDHGQMIDDYFFHANQNQPIMDMAMY